MAVLSRREEVVIYLMMTVIIGYSLYFIGCCCAPKVTVNLAASDKAINDIKQAHVNLAGASQAAMGITLAPLNLTPYEMKPDTRQEQDPGDQSGDSSC
jgi:hypothetical protein